MLRDYPEKIINIIANWTEDYLRNSGKRSLIICKDSDLIIESDVIKHICDEFNILNIVVESDNLKDVALNIVNLALEKDGLTTAPFNKEFYFVVRDHYKFFNFDIAPLANFYRSEVAELYSHIFGKEELEKLHNIDHWVFNDLTWRELEWASRYHSDIILSHNMPDKHKDWFKLTFRQKQCIAFLHQRDKHTRHKLNSNLPMIERNNEILF